MQHSSDISTSFTRCLILGSPSPSLSWVSVHNSYEKTLLIFFSLKAIVAEGGSSVSFVNRSEHSICPVPLLANPGTSGSRCCKRSSYLGKEEECRRTPRLWLSKVRKIDGKQAPILNLRLRTSKIFPDQTTKSFHGAVRTHLLEELRGLDPTALLVMRGLIRRGLHEKNDPDAVNLRESYGEKNTRNIQTLLIMTFFSAQAERFASGRPTEQFTRIANKEIKHKLWSNLIYKCTILTFNDYG